MFREPAERDGDTGVSNAITIEPLVSLDALRAIEGGGRHPLRECVREAVDNYFENLEGHGCSDLFRMVMGQVEAPLLEAVMRHTGGIQSSAAELLGISRGTLRKKLREYDLI